MEEKDPICHDHGSASSGDVKKVKDLSNREEKAIEYLNLKKQETSMGKVTPMAILAMPITV